VGEEEERLPEPPIAAEAGMLAGDRITAIDGIPLTELGMQTAIARIRGVAGTTIAVAFLRGETPMQLVVTRKALRF
jgi:carboxyl-terminal processing protease